MDEFSDGKLIFDRKPDAIQYDKDGNPMAHWFFSRIEPQLKVYPDPNSPTLIYATHVADKKWVGLTDEERYLNDVRTEEEIEYARAIEAKLKEKNT